MYNTENYYICDPFLENQPNRLIKKCYRYPRI